MADDKTRAQKIELLRARSDNFRASERDTERDRDQARDGRERDNRQTNQHRPRPDRRRRLKR